MATRNLLLGGGENLAGRATIVRGGGPKKRPYTLAEVRAELLAPVQGIAAALRGIPASAKPRGEGVFEMTLHPSFLARSYYPAKLLAATGLRDVGSKEKTIIPRKASEDRLEGKPHATASILVAGREDGINKLASFLSAESVPDYIGSNSRKSNRSNGLARKIRCVVTFQRTTFIIHLKLHCTPGPTRTTSSSASRGSRCSWVLMLT